MMMWILYLRWYLGTSRYSELLAFQNYTPHIIFEIVKMIILNMEPVWSSVFLQLSIVMKVQDSLRSFIHCIVSDYIADKYLGATRHIPIAQLVNSQKVKTDN